jgi:hypothetical protein
MLLRNAWQVAAACLMLIGVTATAGAQQAATSFDELRALVKAGDTVTVIDTVGHAIRGKVADISSSSIELLRKDGRKTLAEADVNKIRQWKHGDMGKGATWGAGIGGGLGLLFTVAIAGACECSSDLLVGSVAFYTALGAGIGVVSAARIHEEVIFFKPGAAPKKVTVSPLIGQKRRGVLVSYTF